MTETNPEETAKRLLSCECRGGIYGDDHPAWCPAFRRPAVAAALAQVEAEKVAEIKYFGELASKHRDELEAEIKRLRKACNAYSEAEILGGELLPCTHDECSLEEHDDRCPAFFRPQVGALRTRLAEAERERDKIRRGLVNGEWFPVAKAEWDKLRAARDAAEAKGVKMGLERARDVIEGLPDGIDCTNAIDAEISNLEKNLTTENEQG